MINIKNFQNSKKNSPTTFNSVGVFKAIVTDVLFSEDYVDGEALEIRYNVSTPQGDKPYREIFFMKDYIERTRDFVTYLSSHDIPLSDVTEFVGCHEELTFKKAVRGTSSMLTIAHRDFLGKGSVNNA